MMNLLAFLFILPTAASADVIFVDLNHVAAEIAVVRAELAKRKPPEKLILLPLEHGNYVSRADADAILDDKIQVKAQLYEQKCKNSSSDGCQQIQSDYLNLKEQKKKPDQVYNVDALQKDFASLPAGTVSSVMVSGHHVRQDNDHSSQFYGEFGNIPVDGFLEAVKSLKGRDQVSSVYLLGCRSAIPEDLGGVWKTAFPNANYIVGYENTGFLKDNPSGHTFIRKAMNAEKSILASTSTQEAINKFQAISPKNSTYGTAACLTLPKSSSPIFISSSKGSSDLSNKLGCAGTSEKVKVAIEYMKCVESSQSNVSCPLKDVSKVSVLAKKECDFQIPQQLNEAVKFRSQQKVLENLMNPGAKVNFSTIFSKAPESLKKDLHLSEPPASLNDAKSKLEAIKKSIDAEFDFNKISKADISTLNERAQTKLFFDNAYLAVSNLDIAKYDALLSSMEYPMTDRGGILRAEAFQQKAEVDKSLDYAERIKEVESQLGTAPSGDARGALRKEVEALKNYSSRN